jgi:hypothetical protein
MLLNNLKRKSSTLVAHACNPRYSGVEIRRITKKKTNPLQKTGRAAQAARCLPSKHKALNSKL